MLFYFRPYFWLTIFFIPSLILLLGLGIWQLKRLEVKSEIIKTFKDRAYSNPINLPFNNVKINAVEFKRVVVKGFFLNDKEIYLNGKTYEGNAGFHVITPFKTNNDQIVFVNRGWVSEKYRLPSSRPFSIINKEIEIDTILRSPQKKGYFVPENDPKNGFWFTLNPKEIANWLEIENSITSFYLDVLRKKDIITLPIAPKINIDIRNVHLNYALTWFGIALSLIGVYLSYHLSNGRIGFKK